MNAMNQWYFFMAGYCMTSVTGECWNKMFLLDELGAIDPYDAEKYDSAEAAFDKLVENEHLIPSVNFPNSQELYKWNHHKHFDPMEV